jgi:hypothetical protein
MAGNARPLEVLMGNNMITSINWIRRQITRGAADKIKEQIAFLNSKDFNVNSPKEKPFNLSGITGNQF